jgi:plastocyanin domain-containing protein
MKKLAFVFAAAAALATGVAAAEAPAPRRVEVQVTGEGYKPSTVQAKPGEKLVLVFKVAGDPGCCDRIVVPSANFRGTAQAGKPLEVPVTVPDTGKLTFACSMNMCKGEVIPIKK